MPSGRSPAQSQATVRAVSTIPTPPSLHILHFSFQTSLITTTVTTGVDLLRDGRDTTYWQSDGPQPHLVTLQFQKKVLLTSVALQTDYKLDESYTPAKISIRVGSCWSDLREVKVIELSEPQGWCMLPLTHETTDEYVHSSCTSSVVLSNTCLMCVPVSYNLYHKHQCITGLQTIHQSLHCPNSNLDKPSKRQRYAHQTIENLWSKNGCNKINSRQYYKFH